RQRVHRLRDQEGPRDRQLFRPGPRKHL
ncbi:uncharacterized protein METZ01_LOCUS403004, partial [marine metagenome]